MDKLESLPSGNDETLHFIFCDIASGNCTYTDGIESIKSYARLQIEKDRDRIKLHAKVKHTEGYSATGEFKSKSQHAFIDIMAGFTRTLVVDPISIDETPITLD